VRTCVGKSLKNPDAQGISDPYPSKKKSFSAWGRSRQIAIEPKHSTYSIFFISFV